MLPPLSLETAYSFNGSNITLDALFAYAEKNDMKHVALTDWTMHAAYKFYQRARSRSLKPILGLKAHIEPHFTDRPLHAVFYAQNEQGYKNLLKLSSLQSVHGVIRYDALKAHSDSTSVMLISRSGELNELSTEENAMRSLIEKMKELVKDLFIDRPDTVPGIPSVPIEHVRYLNKSDKDVHDVLSHILHKKLTPSEGNVSLEGFKAPTERNYKSFIEQHGLTLSNIIASLPKFPSKEEVSSERFLRALAHKGLEKRLSKAKGEKGAYYSRLEKELQTIHDLGYDDYFLIIWDVIRFAKSSDILVGPGRGSAPGSLVSYALGITSIDPLEHGLLFERFLNKARETMPDIDIDFPDDKRDDVVRYVKDKYGPQYVALICTFGTFLSKSALRDSGRVLGIEPKFIDEMAKRVSEYDSIKHMMENDADTENRITTYENIGKWLNIAKKLEGLPRHVSTHAAGVMVSERPLIDYTALQSGLNTLYQTQYEQSDLEAMGLLKIDFLGLKNLSMIESVIEHVEQDKGKRINLHKVPLDDARTFRMLREKSTTGLFQLESAGMRNLIKRMQIRSFDDIAVVLALYRPGPMESIPTFLKRRFGKAPIESIAEEIDPILKDTQGILLYQEQIMKIATDFAGYSLNEADILRRAVSKKDANVLEGERKNFVRKAYKNDKSEDVANKVYDYIVKFANYGFNKSHSVAYGLVAYWMAYLKANYPQYFIAVLMQNALNNEGQMRAYMQEVHDHNLELNGPDARKSTTKFVMENRTLIFPLNGIKTLGNRTVKSFLEIRKTHFFKSFVHFVKETRKVFTSRNFEYLIAAGALDFFGYSKRTLMENLKPLLNFIDYDQALPLDEFIFNTYDEYDGKTLETLERDALGFNIKHDVLSPYLGLARKKHWNIPSDIESVRLNVSLSMLGVLTRVKEIKTKKGDKMAFLGIEDKANEIDSVVFPNAFKNIGVDLSTGTVYRFDGKVGLKEGKRQFIVERIAKVAV